MNSRTFSIILTVIALALGASAPASGQFPGAPEPPDPVDQLAQLLGLSEEQETEIRSVMEEINPQLEDLQIEAHGLQMQLEAQIGPEFDEKEVREIASKLGELSGEMTALSVILQSRVEGALSEEQRQTLEDLERQQRQQQQQQLPPPPQPQEEVPPPQEPRGPVPEQSRQ